MKRLRWKKGLKWNKSIALFAVSTENSKTWKYHKFLKKH